MSFPRQIQVLVIEDDHKVKEYYEELFASIKDEYSINEPHFAFCLEDAEARLASDTIYHLVILDLRLPETPDEPALENQHQGLLLLERCLTRNNYPIPVLLTISAHLGRTVHQTDLNEKVRKGFSYGAVIVKGPDLLPDIKTAVERAQKYCDVGIHVCANDHKVFPTLDPRDEDLLRRAVLHSGLNIGLDLKWWSAEYDRPTGQFADAMGWTKVLFGRFLLNDGKGHSRYLFFKLAPAGGAHYVHLEAAYLQHKLQHIKVLCSVISGNRSLLITESVNAGNNPPISLETFLSRPSDEVLPQLPGIVERVASQVAALGEVTVDTKRLSELLWQYHDEERIKTQWEKREGSKVVEELGDAADPWKTREELIANQDPIRYRKQSFLHGDLNFTNISLEDEPGATVANIFDASGINPAVNVRDLAMLEVTALLHQLDDECDSLVKYCDQLYCDQIQPPDDLVCSQGSSRARNTLKLISEVRKQALLRVEDPKIYALMVYDNALMQFGGLWFGSSVNKICIPAEATYLAGVTSRWLRRVAPQFFATR